MVSSAIAEAGSDASSGSFNPIVTIKVVPSPGRLAQFEAFMHKANALRHAAQAEPAV